MEVELEVKEPGYYMVGAQLRSSATGEFITSRGSNKVQPEGGGKASCFIDAKKSGKYLAKIRFSGEDIRRSRIDGPYEIELVILDEKGYVCDTVRLISPKYEHQQFCEQQLLLKVLDDYGKDIDGDGLYEYITLKLELFSIVPKKYFIRGDLYYTLLGFAPIATTSSLQMIEGKKIIELDFPLSALRIFRVSGDFIADVEVSDENYSFTISQEYKLKHRYSWRQVKLVNARFTRKFSVKGEDKNGNGLYESLVVNIEIEVRKKGNYSIEGWLYDKDSKAIDVASVDKHLKRGKTVVSLEFNGISIRRNQKDAPYSLKFLILKQNEEPVDVIKDAYTISGYRFKDFEKDVVLP